MQYNLDKVFVVDIETDGLLDELTKLHVLSCAYKDDDNSWNVKSTNRKEDIKKLFENPANIIVGHFFLGFDKPALQKLYPDVEFNAFIIDSLGISWYLHDERRSHGLESYGEEMGVPKPKIDDWDNLTYEEYKHRCEEDVKINTNIWVKFLRELRDIYNNDKDILRVIRYLNFKIECLHDQERLKVRVDKKAIQEAFDFFLPLQEEKFETLKAAMPKVPIKAKRTKPKVFYKKDGSLSKAAVSWLELLKQEGLPEDTEGEIEYIKDYDEPNPKSPEQVKNWLYSLGWKPTTFESRKNTKGEFNEVPQVNLKGGGLCDSVKKLSEIEPAVKELEGLGIIKHRLGLLKSFQECEKDGYVVAGARALTNTLRLKHVRPIVNLPGYTGTKDISDGYWIRGCLIAPDGYEVVGSDMSSLEDRVKQSFIYPYDPEYVEEMNKEGFDPHLDLAVLGGALTPEQAEAHKKGEEDYKAIRHNFKTGNYSCQYGAGAAKIAKTLDVPLKEGKRIHRAYWKRNWAVKKVAEDSFYKQIGKKYWVLNPINKFYYPLRNTKDIFSVLCQGGGTYIFDIWLYNMRREGIIPVLQMHDEMMAYTKPEDREKVKKILKDSVSNVNRQLPLNREMDVDVQFGDNYASVH